MTSTRAASDVRPATERAAAALVGDPRSSAETVDAALEAFPTELVLGALVRRPGPAHRALDEAMAGRGVLYDALYYAVVDLDADGLDLALQRASDPSTWQVMASAIANAPAATHDQLRRLQVLLGESAHEDDVLVADLLAGTADRLAD